MNPLTSSRVKPPESAPDPMLRHAQIWQHVGAQTPETLQSHIATMDHVLPVLGQLAGDPKVTAKDVIKAATNAVAAGAMEPSVAVATIADMPADPDKLRPWLKAKYADALMTTVHAKAAIMQQAQPQPQPQPAQGPAAAPAPAAPAPEGPAL